MREFFDVYGNKIELTFSENFFPEAARHVLILCQYGDEWLLTNHKERGYEFPGGKAEAGETIDQAARREVYEETGAILEELKRLGEYRVSGENDTFVKAVFWGKVTKIEATNSYFETNGPVIMKGELLQQRLGEQFSFIMKDGVVKEYMDHIHDLQSKKE